MENTITKNEAGLISKVLTISKKEGGKYVEQGKVTIFIPTLDLFGIAAVQKQDDKGQLMYEDGLPVYSDEKAQYIFNSIVAAVKGKARNALKTGTAELKDGAKIASTLAEVMEVGTPGGGGAEALAAIRELKKDFAAWVASLKKSQKASEQIIGYFNNRDALALMTDVTKEKMLAYLSAYMEQASEEMLTKGQKYLQSVADAAEIKEDTDEEQDF